MILEPQASACAGYGLRRHFKIMRIIAGSLKGRRLATVKGRMRPTSDKVREAIFNILGPAVLEARVLDLFAGTGALGLEALSRGARAAVFVEDHPTSLAVLRQNVETLGLAAQVEILPLPVKAGLKKLAARQAVFELAFLDPPYGSGLAAATLEDLARAGILSPSAWVVAEHSRREALPEAVETLKLREMRRYGDTRVALYVLQKNLEIQESAD
ncbi:MAG: 16S rRNA (guanine(966)-N(2))-methyltransferase RsmD [Deltaproteobacteria bacterium]|nr:16S rRNA (guanine(966)-N(2))-methyltransferase RsmD [Deltaproteobacteria bacterium]